MLHKDNEIIFISVRKAIRCMLKQELVEKSFIKAGLLIEPNEDKGSISSLMYGLQDDITQIIFELMGLSVHDENISFPYYKMVNSINIYDDIDNIAESIFDMLKGYSNLCNLPAKGRVTEIASKVIDGLIVDDKDAALVYLREEVELNKEECDFFGVDYKEMISTE